MLAIGQKSVLMSFYSKEIALKVQYPAHQTYQRLHYTVYLWWMSSDWNELILASHSKMCPTWHTYGLQHMVVTCFVSVYLWLSHFHKHMKSKCFQAKIIKEKLYDIHMILHVLLSFKFGCVSCFVRWVYFLHSSSKNCVFKTDKWVKINLGRMLATIICS